MVEDFWSSCTPAELLEIYIHNGSLSGQHTKAMVYEECFPAMKPMLRPLIRAREKETTIMKHVSLKAKLPSMCVLGALGVTFLLSPLGAFAKCGGGGGGGNGAAAAAPVASIKSVEAFSSCSTRPISSTQASKLAADGWADSTTKNGAKATVGTGTGTTTTAPVLTPAQLKSISFLAGNASCSFSSVDPAVKVNLNNGDMFLAVLGNGAKSNQPVFGMVVGGKVVLFTADQNGNHFANLLQSPKIQIDNGILTGK